MSRRNKYQAFIGGKGRKDLNLGHDVTDEEINDLAFDFQSQIIRWALSLGRSAIFADCGLGKTIMQLEWSRHVVKKTGMPVLILAPLAVTSQTEDEAEKFGIEAAYSSDGTILSEITITNYERLHHFDAESFGGVVLDESSILKSFTGRIRTEIIRAFERTPYRLACTATPAPNDHMELGNHAEFLGICTRSEMLSEYFVHDAGKTQDWRLKGHAEDDFWAWVSSWATMIETPADIGCDGTGYDLPELRIHHETVASGNDQSGRTLFKMEAQTLTERREARKDSLDDRCARVAHLVNDTEDAFVVWVNFNAEGDLLEKMIPDAVQVSGSDSPEDKTDRLVGFSEGRYRVIITKPRIGGFGLNWQHAHQVAFCGLSDSYEQFYQAVRRCWRFGQECPVDVHIVTSEAESAVVRNIKRKEEGAKEMSRKMIEKTREGSKRRKYRSENTGPHEVTSGDGWSIYHGDCVDVVSDMDDDSIDYSIFSPPFASLYTYSDSPRDMGNCRDIEEFSEHFGYLVPELYRVTRPGRLLSFHCMNLPTSKSRDGFIGIQDFRGDLIAEFQEAGWIFHSEVTIWKDPVVQMQRTKALGLLHKQIKKDSAMSRQGLADYLITMRKPGENSRPISHTNETFPVERWQRYASPVWMDINPSDTLQKQSAREEKDERHICPLQLGVIERAMELWTVPGDLVLSPFTGIGSEGHVAMKMNRRFVGAELKESYYKQACANVRKATQQMEMFA